MFAPLTQAPKAAPAAALFPIRAPDPPRHAALRPGVHPSGNPVRRALQSGMQPAVSSNAQRANWDFANIPVFAPAPGLGSATPPLLQRKRATGATDLAPGLAVPALVGQVLRRPGQPLETATRDFFEPRFKQDFGAVRVHTDPQANQSAGQIDSQAYTNGPNIVFGAGRYAPGTPAGKALLAHELTHVVQQRHAARDGALSLGKPADPAEHEAERVANGVEHGLATAAPGPAAAGQVVRRAPGPATAPAHAPVTTPGPAGTAPGPSPPGWLGPLRAGATHLEGDVWDVQIASLGKSPVGPYDQLAKYLGRFNRTRPAGAEPMEAAHIIGGEHIQDLGWNMTYEQAPCIGVAESLHDQWSRIVSNLQSKAGALGGRTTATLSRTHHVGPDDVIALYNDAYRGIPELQRMSRDIVKTQSRTVARQTMASKLTMPKHEPPIDAHQSGIPKREPPIDGHRGGMPKREPPIDAHQGGMPKREPPMDAHKGGMPKREPPIDAHQSGMPKHEPPMDAHQSGMPKHEPPMDAHQSGMPKLEPPMDAHQGGIPKLEPAIEPHSVGLPGVEPAIKPKLGFVGRLKNAKTAILEGFEGAFSPEGIAGMVPDLVLTLADIVAAREAVRTIQTKFAKEGFAKGFAAGVTGWTAAEVAENLKNHVTMFRVKGLEDPAGFLSLTSILQMAEAYENFAVDLGYRYSSSKSLKWKEAMRNKGFPVLAKYGYHFGDDPQRLFEYGFIDKLGWVLRSETDPIVEKAISRADDRKDAEARKMRRETGTVGNKI